EGLPPHSVVQELVQSEVARRLDSLIRVTLATRIAEVVGFIDHDSVSELGDPSEPLGKIAFPAEIGVTEDSEVAKVGVPADAAYVRQPFTQVRLPHNFLSRLGSKQYHTLGLMQHEALNQHQSHEGLAQTNAVAQERSAVLSGDFHQRPIGLFLIAIDS